MKENFKKWLSNGSDKIDSEVTPYPEKEVVYVEELSYKLSKKEVEAIEKHSIRVSKINYLILAILSVILYFTIILIAITHLPIIGSQDVPTFNYVAISYITRSLIDTRAVNAVTGMILDYRAFDTLGESFVLFSAVTVTFILLSEFKSKDEIMHHDLFNITKDPIVRLVSSIAICIIVIFGIYVILNGHLSPGGGFSGGALIGAALILYSLAFGNEKASSLFKLSTFKTISAIALLGYCLTKSYSFFVGGMGIHVKDIFSIFPIGSILSGGFILILNICVGLVVSCTMYGIYCLFKKGEI